MSISLTQNSGRATPRNAYRTQHSLKAEFERSGIGLHSGIFTTVRVLPATAGEGRYFVRVDLPGAPVIPAQVDAVCETRLSTELRIPIEVSTEAMNDASTEKEASVRTVEHLLAALAGSGVDDARIEIDGPEVPLLDGSAKNWVEAIASVGVVASGAKEAGEAKKNSLSEMSVEDSSPSPDNSLSSFVLQEAVFVSQGDAFVAALPAPITRFTYGIEFDLPAIGKQWHSWTPGQESFAEAIAPARTFGLAHQIEQLQQAGLIKGGSLENALVCDEQGWLNPPLRFSNEPVRHKLLDLVGDLSLLGNFPVAHFLAYKASHNLHIQLAKKLAVAYR
ncbi:MAG: UDP-3-O-acyl-N-acetylglucosamine deacetylase [Cyanobacteriota bacterium]|nr:UDP-3-O-acyl-N-acetylglucosamine deacetylase [Cyanobacteriota bacterium]